MQLWTNQTDRRLPPPCVKKSPSLASPNTGRRRGPPLHPSQTTHRTVRRRQHTCPKSTAVPKWLYADGCSVSCNVILTPVVASKTYAVPASIPCRSSKACADDDVIARHRHCKAGLVVVTGRQRVDQCTGDAVENVRRSGIHLAGVVLGRANGHGGARHGHRETEQIGGIRCRIIQCRNRRGRRRGTKVENVGECALLLDVLLSSDGVPTTR